MAPEYKPLPPRRKSFRVKVHLADGHGTSRSFYLDFGEYPDGTLGEIWIDTHKEGTFVRGVLGALARVISKGLQHGVPVEVFVDALKDLNFPPNGEVEGSLAVRAATSVVDWVAREMEVAYVMKCDHVAMPEGTLPELDKYGTGGGECEDTEIDRT